MSETNKNSKKLWGGRYCGETNFDLTNLNNSLNVDARLYKEDIEGSLAYAKALEKAGLLRNEELNLIIDGLQKVLIEWEENKIEFLESDEDVHTVNERRLTEIIGIVGGKLHTGRSRNDQIVTDMKIWIKNAIDKIVFTLFQLLESIIVSAEKNIDILMPGYTHLQRAQPIRFSHWILSYGFFLQSDITRFKDLYKKVDYLPLGSGAIAGNPFLIDRNFIARKLNFANITPNSMLAVSDRDFIVEFNFVSSLTSMHLSRFSEDLILYSTKEFNFIQLADAFTTGSSLMPQKRNPDSLELIRGLSGEIFGQLSGFMMTIKGLPSTYNKDLQSDKSSMFLVFDKLKLGLKVMDGIIRTLKINESNCRKALSYDMLATDIAYYLVRNNIAFREAHHISGKVVAYAEEHKISLNQIPIEQLKKISPAFGDDIKEIWNFEKSVEQYQVHGGTAKASVLQQIKILEQFVSDASHDVFYKYK